MISDHFRHKTFIEGMVNKSDYSSFVHYCEAMGLSVLTHAEFVAAATTGEMPSRGLGDTVAKFTHATGLDKLATLYTHVTGKPCGCSSRQDALNKLVPYK